jgi:hypothetical protein
MHPRASIVRVVAVMTVAGMLVGAGAASATTKKKTQPPVCKLVKAQPGGVSDQSLDITSADVASNATTLTSVIRVVKLSAGTSDTATPTGREWDMNFTVSGKEVTLQVYDGPFGAVAGTGTPTLDTAKNEVRINVSLADLASKLGVQIKNKSSVLTNFVVTSKSTVEGPAIPGVIGAGTYFQTGQTDRATSPAKYTAGASSCVVVGK